MPDKTRMESPLILPQGVQTKATDVVILLVMNSPVDQEWFETVLANEGFLVEVRHTEQDVLDFLKDSNPNLILLDSDLPDDSGYDLCKKIRAQRVSEHVYIPIMMVTASKHGGARVEGYESGADDVLIKPATPTDLIARAYNQLRIQELQDTLWIANKQLSRAKQMVDREMEKVGELQKSFLPQQLPTHASFSLGAFYQPTAVAGGDYYDVIPLSETRWGIVIADIAGHGVSAAVVMAMFQMTLKEFVSEDHSPQVVVQHVNTVLSRYVQSHHFVTMLYGVLDLSSREMRYCSAGHHPMLRYSSATNTVCDVETEPEFPLCTFQMQSYPEDVVHLEQGDSLLLFTDGVLDVTNAQQESFGVERLQLAFRDSISPDAMDTVRAINTATHDFSDSIDPSDDYTLLAITAIP